MKTLALLAIVWTAAPALASAQPVDPEQQVRAELVQLPPEESYPTPTPRSEALARLGAILAAKGDRPGAIAGLRDSVVAGHSAKVRDQLRALDRAAAEAVDAMAPVAMAGPFGSPVEACLAQARDADACTARASRPIASPSAALRGIAALWLPDHAPRLLAVQTAAGWYARELDEHLGGNSFHCGTTRLAIDRAIARRGGAIEVDYSDAASCFHRGEDWAWSEQRFAVVGVGPSGIPMMSPGFARRLDQTSHGKVTLTIRRTARWDAAGELTVTGSAQDASGEPTELELGRHTFVFK